MTDPHDLDELATAHLDGATSPEEAARLAGDPELRAGVEARAEELAAVRRALAEVSPVDPVRRDTAIAAALAAYDEETMASAGPTVVPLAPRRGLSARAVRVVGAAAVILLIALLVPLLASLGDDDDETATFSETGAAIAGDAAEDASDGGAGEERAAPSTTTRAPQQTASVSTAQVVDLGTFEDLDALAAAVAAGESGPPADTAAFDSSSDEDQCTDEPGGTLLAVAVVDGAPVLVYVFGADEGSPTLRVFRRGGCELLGEREL
jgi:hypothetical protein